MNLLIYLIGLTLVVAPGLTQRRIVRQGRQCYTPENNIGQCYALSYCPAIANVLNIYERNVATRYLRAAQRSCGNINYQGDPVVCCDISQQFTTAPPPLTNPRNPFFPTNQPIQPTFEQTTQQFITPTPPTPPRPQPTTTTTTTTTTTLAPSTTEGASSPGGRPCTSPDLEAGTCIPLAKCAKLINRLRANPKDEIFVKYLRASNVGCGNEYSVVCCPSDGPSQRQIQKPAIFPQNTDEIPTKLLSKEDGCGYVHNELKKIVGGSNSKIGAWPWIALIGYDDGFSDSPFKCGGALITSRHVLTAAHCIRSDLTFVRLGEHDLSRTDEAQHVDVPVVKVLKHPNYTRSNGRNDIALLYLGENVQFSARITPICIPFEPRLRSKDITDYNPFVAGWGKTTEGGKSSTILQQLQIPVVSNEECKEDYKRVGKFLSEDQFDNAVLCAGVRVGGKDTCQGDSGGPLMLPEIVNMEARFYLVGVVSYGIGCARPEIPGVYTRVSNFIEWIADGVADTP